jgi:hypothetical protein
MAGVLERIMQSRKRIIRQNTTDVITTKVLQLQMAKEILAETFGISVLDVEEMIRMRCEEKQARRALDREMRCGLRIRRMLFIRLGSESNRWKT